MSATSHAQKFRSYTYTPENGEYHTKEVDVFRKKSEKFFAKTVEKTDNLFFSYFIYQKYWGTFLFCYLNPKREIPIILPQIPIKEFSKIGIYADQRIIEYIKTAFSKRAERIRIDEDHMDDQVTIVYQEASKEGGYDFNIYNYQISAKEKEIFDAVEKMPDDLVKSIVKKYLLQASPQIRRELQEFEEGLKMHKESEDLKKKPPPKGEG